ncbi:MAG: lysophospholipase [Planctomycetota bacterium]|nr:lysophospholipase [Planctomycetota bacterium]
MPGRTPFAIGSLVLAGLLVASVQADDLERLLKKAARNAAQGTLNPAPPPRGVKPQATAAPRGESHPLKTADGWTLVIHHYRPTSAPRAGAMPVILCHGLTYNATFWDLDPSCSFAEYLAARGYDVWAVDLRGSGLSQKWVWKADEAPEMILGGALRRISRGKLAPTGYATVDPKAANWSLDHHIAYDVPAAVKFVRTHTGAPEVAWVGHSMGGIVAIGHLARYGNPGIGRLATIGSQVTMPNGQLPLQFLAEMAGTRKKQLLGQVGGAELMDATKTSVHNMFFNVANADPKIYEALSGPATDIPGIGLMQQYSILARRGELFDAGQRVSYAKLVDRITIPIFISCGASDQFAPPIVQKYLYDHVGSTDKTLVIFGQAGGCSVDCGHDDSLVGLKSRAEVFPVIETWLRGGK